jgi:hypothetical protein
VFEILHRKAEIEKQEYRKEFSPSKEKIALC